ncbi:hypothetical protein [Prosthecobacter dejongeii]|uniref:YXWGXW repeat-containing protein n=1 Tax=Prosthecobacter dejongeii TaxID=48465 RepID=A0A7W7YQE1_9BACT|nr:hypothetical protein [Prosthecobacter dejongeii]MBB5040434.1 hypothetical protein [Prosthecobacter dejongeii]
MKTSLLGLALAPALLLTSCYVTPAGGPYDAPGPRPGPGFRGHHRPGSSYGRDRDHHDHDHRDNDRDGRYDRDRDGRYDRDGRGRPGYGYQDPRSPRSPGGTVVLPGEARRVIHGGSTYYTHRNVWYRPSGSGYIIVTRPY